MAIRKYDSTVARIAGNILSGLVSGRSLPIDFPALSRIAVAEAREIVAETIRTEASAEGDNKPTGQPVIVRATESTGGAPV